MIEVLPGLWLRHDLIGGIQVEHKTVKVFDSVTVRYESADFNTAEDASAWTSKVLTILDRLDMVSLGVQL